QRVGHAMSPFNLKYVHSFRDRHGKARCYFRRPGFKRVPLAGAPLSEEFMAAYWAAIAAQALPVGAKKTVQGMVNAAVVGYYNSLAFKSLSPKTAKKYRYTYEAFRAEHGDKRIALLERRHIERMLADKAATPFAANNFLKPLHLLMQFAVAEGMRRDDPTFG